jgi:hypothetical protein
MRITYFRGQLLLVSTGDALDDENVGADAGISTSCPQL